MGIYAIENNFLAALLQSLPAYRRVWYKPFNIMMSMNRKIVVIGSANTDMVINMERLPLPGETLLGGRFFMNPGGKGANQAVAAARLGGKVNFIAKVGNDPFGIRAIDQYKAEGIGTKHVVVDKEHPSGVALILVDARGENSIAVASGANAHLTAKDIDEARSVIEDSHPKSCPCTPAARAVAALLVYAHRQ